MQKMYQTSGHGCNIVQFTSTLSSKDLYPCRRSVEVDCCAVVSSLVRLKHVYNYGIRFVEAGITL